MQWEYPDGTLTKSCPRNNLDVESMQLLSLYKHYKNGLLPVGGGLLDQSAQYLEAMEIIDVNT